VVLDALSSSAAERRYPASIGTPAYRDAARAWMERELGVHVELGARVVGLTGTVFGVMETFGGVAQAGQANLSAMAYHYESQPLPPWTAWYWHHLPARAHQLETLATFVMELGVPFLVFGLAPMRLAASGHPGSITSVHAGSCALAFEQMSLMIRESGAGGGLRMNEIKWLLSVVVDVIVQFDRDERGRFISEVFYEPRRQRLGRWDESMGVHP
jgi:hypothetical protein